MKAKYVCQCTTIYTIGIIIVAIGFLGAYIFENSDIGFTGLFIGSILMIPFSWKLYINNRASEGDGIFWFQWFLALPLLILVCLIYFLKRVIG